MQQSSFRKKIELNSTIDSNENLNIEVNLMGSSPTDHLPMNRNRNNYKTMAYCMQEETKITEWTFAQEKSSENHVINSFQSQIFT